MRRVLRLDPGPGRFEGCLVLDRYLHELAKVIPAEELEVSREPRWWAGLLLHTLIPGNTLIPGKGTSKLLKITSNELEYLASLKGAIVCEDDQGHVTIQHFTDEEEARVAWNAILAMKKD